MASLSSPHYYPHRWRYWYRQVFRKIVFLLALQYNTIQYNSLFSRRLRHLYSAKMFVRRHYALAFLLRLHCLCISLLSSRHLSSWNICAKPNGKNIAVLAHKVTTMSDGANFTFSIVSIRRYIKMARHSFTLIWNNG